MSDLLASLQRTSELLAHSEESAWSTRSPAKLKKAIDGQIDRIAKGKKPRKWILVDLFAATGDVQEVSISNGWAEEFLRLAEEVDQHANSK